MAFLGALTALGGGLEEAEKTQIARQTAQFNQQYKQEMLQLREMQLQEQHNRQVGSTGMANAMVDLQDIIQRNFDPSTAAPPPGSGGDAAPPPGPQSGLPGSPPPGGPPGAPQGTAGASPGAPAPQQPPAAGMSPVAQLGGWPGPPQPGGQPTQPPRPDGGPSIAQGSQTAAAGPGAPQGATAQPAKPIPRPDEASAYQMPGQQQQRQAGTQTAQAGQPQQQQQQQPQHQQTRQSAVKATTEGMAYIKSLPINEKAKAEMMKALRLMINDQQRQANTERRAAKDEVAQGLAIKKAQREEEDMKPKLKGRALDAAGEIWYKSGKMPAIWDRHGATKSAIIERGMELHPNESTDDIAERQQAFRAGEAGLRQLQTRTDNLMLAGNEVKRLVPRLLEQSEEFSRSRFPTINSLIQAVEKGGGGETVARFNLSLQALSRIYARILQVGAGGSGVVTVDTVKEARDKINENWGNLTMRAAMDQIIIELEGAEGGIRDTYQGLGVPLPPAFKEEKKHEPIASYRFKQLTDQGMPEDEAYKKLHDEGY